MTGADSGEPSQHSDYVSCIAISGDGKYIASGSYDTTIRVWDATLGTAVGEPLRGHRGWVRSVAFSPDGTAIVSGSNDATIRLWKTTTGELIKQITDNDADHIRGIYSRWNSNRFRLE